MVIYEVMTPGKKIKKIRKQISASQEAITAGKFKRELISLIENDKVKLVKSTAVILVANINKIIQDKKINKEPISVDEILEAPCIQIKKFIELYKNQLNHIKMGEDEKALRLKMEEIEEFFNEYNVIMEKKCEVYEILAQIFYDRANWEESKTYYSLCRDISLIKENNESVLKYLALLTRAYYRLDNPKEILTIGKFGNQLICKHGFEDYKDTKVIYYNSALAYCKLNRLDEAIGMLNKILIMPGLARIQILDLSIQKGSCYLKKNEYDMAEQCFRHVMDIANTDTNANASALAYLNLAVVKFETGDYYSAEKFADMASEITTTDVYNRTSNLYNLVLLYIRLNKINKLDKYYIEAIEHSLTIQDESIQKDLLNKLSEYFIKNAYYKRLEKLLLLIKHKVFSKELKIKEVIEIYIIAAETFRKSDKNKFLEIYECSISLIKFLRKTN